MSIMGNITFTSISRYIKKKKKHKSKFLFLFLVMAIRSMGQFIGREQAYSSINIFQNFQEIYNRQGIGGFFV